MTVTPYALKDAPSLIEKIFPAQRISIEAYKEQMAGSGKTLAPMGSYWKGRKPLILVKACVLGCLLPATDDLTRDLAVFEMLMGMDDVSLRKRLTAKNDADSRIMLRNLAHGNALPFKEQVQGAKRPEECGDQLFDHVWDEINSHLGTQAHTMPELVEQLGMMRFGNRPRVADTFCGSGQIPFEAARLGCEVYASDLNPIACMLTWGAFNIVGTTSESQEEIEKKQLTTLSKVQIEIDALGIEKDENGWISKAFLYCVEARCPQTGWMVPLLPSRIISRQRTGQKSNAIVELIPDPVGKRYDIKVLSNVNEKDLKEAENGTVQKDGRGGEAVMVHNIGGQIFRTKLSTLRGDYQKEDGTNSNHLRLWEKGEFLPRPNDIYQERLYCVQWIMQTSSKYEFRAVTEDDLYRERKVEQYIAEHLEEWQEKGWLPDMRIETGYNTDQPIRERGWTYWHHLFNPRQLLIAGLINKYSDSSVKLGLCRILNANSRLSRWDSLSGGGGCVQATFDNQSLNTLLNYGCRSLFSSKELFQKRIKTYSIMSNLKHQIKSKSAIETETINDLFITDPPYGDAINYDEILDFFIAWLRKNPPLEFSEWIWDSRRSLAIKGADEGFRRGMVSAYKRMTEHMPDNGLQVIMFTHQSVSIWADMSNIVWASGLQVTAAWYVVTETESALRGSNNVKGTVLLVCRKRQGKLKTTRDDLAWEIQEEVEQQVQSLTGLNQMARGFYRDENVFEDADMQMAGYAAALRVLTRYAIIDGRDMAGEALRPRVNGEVTFVDSLINFAVDTANQALVPTGLEDKTWKRLNGAERFYLKMLDMEARGSDTLDNYQNFAKAFKVRDFRPLMGNQKANQARLKSAVEFGREEMNESSELYQGTLRAVLYALMELQKEVPGPDVLAHISLNIPNYYADLSKREHAIELTGYLIRQLEHIRPEEASAARVLSELLKNQRIG